MKKIISNTKITYLGEENNELFYIDYSFDECIWCFNTNQKITIEQSSELYDVLNEFMINNYTFYENELGDYKDDNKLVWHSDCYYNPDDRLSVMDVSTLFIEKNNDAYIIWCEKPIDKLLNKITNFFVIGFSPLGNGRYNSNLETGATLQDDFVIQVYQKILQSKVLKKQK